METNCTGREFLEYAKDILAEEKYSSAVYLGCIAEFEFSKVGDAVGLLEALQLTGLARAHLISELDSEAIEKGIKPTPEYLRLKIKKHCTNKLRPELTDLMLEFSRVQKPILPEDLVKVVEDTLMEIPTIKFIF